MSHTEVLGQPGCAVAAKVVLLEQWVARFSPAPGARRAADPVAFGDLHALPSGNDGASRSRFVTTNVSPVGAVAAASALPLFQPHRRLGV
jgi:hypothetical protein